MGNNVNKNEDVDLQTIINLIKIPISGLWNFSIYTLLLIKKWWIIIFIFIALGAGAGFGLFRVSKPVYASTLVLSSSTLSNDFCADIIYNLDILIKDKTPELLAEKLNIEISTAIQMKGLEFDNYNENIKKKYADADTIVLGRPFKIKAYASSMTVFDTLQIALVKYLENNEYSLKRREIKKENIIRLREKLRENINQLDSLKFSIATNLMTKGNQTNIIISKSEKAEDASSVNDPLNVFKEEIALYKEELGLNLSLALIDNIQVIQDFTPRAKPDSTLFSFISRYASITFVLGLVLVFFIDVWQKRKA